MTTQKSFGAHSYSDMMLIIGEDLATPVLKEAFKRLADNNKPSYWKEIWDNIETKLAAETVPANRTNKQAMLDMKNKAVEALNSEFGELLQDAAEEETKVDDLVLEPEVSVEDLTSDAPTEDAEPWSLAEITEEMHKDPENLTLHISALMLIAPWAEVPDLNDEAIPELTKKAVKTSLESIQKAMEAKAAVVKK